MNKLPLIFSLLILNSFVLDKGHCVDASGLRDETEKLSSSLSTPKKMKESLRSDGGLESENIIQKFFAPRKQTTEQVKESWERKRKSLYTVISTPDGNILKLNNDPIIGFKGEERKRSIFSGLNVDLRFLGEEINRGEIDALDFSNTQINEFDLEDLLEVVQKNEKTLSKIRNINLSKTNVSYGVASFLEEYFLGNPEFKYLDISETKASETSKTFELLKNAALKDKVITIPHAIFQTLETKGCSSLSMRSHSQYYRKNIWHN